MQTFMGYERSDGSVGIRSYVLVLSLVQCANSTVSKIAARCGVPEVTIETGCGGFQEQAANSAAAGVSIRAAVISWVSSSPSKVCLIVCLPAAAALVCAGTAHRVYILSSKSSLFDFGGPICPLTSYRPHSAAHM